MEKRVLITGVSGFAGKYVADSLRTRGYNIFGTGRGSPPQAHEIAHFNELELGNYAQVLQTVLEIQPTHVVHLAAISSVTHGDVAEIYNTNIVGSRNLLQALSESPQPPVSTLITSSANVYGNSNKGVLSESDSASPENDYAVSKIAMEYMARQYRDRMHLVIARPFNYTGRGQSDNFLIPKIVDHFKARAPFIELGNTDVSRDFSDVRTISEYMARLLETQAPSGEIYNICRGEAHSLQTIIEMCQIITGHTIEVRTNPNFKRRNEIKSLSGNTEKLHNAVGTVDTYSLDDTLTWMLNP